MSAPDKVYIHIGPHLEMMQATGIRVGAPGEEEYIRKDSLLKWAKEKNARLDGTGGDYTEGYLHAMIDLIDKLESL